MVIGNSQWYSMDKIRKAIDAVVTAGGYASAALMVIVTLLPIYEVVTRYFLQSPSIWASDFTRYGILYLTFLGAAWVLKEDGHVKIELLTSRFSAGGENLIAALTSTIGCVACGIFCWAVTRSTWDSFQAGQAIVRSVVVPRYLVVWIMPLGTFLLCIQFARRAWKHFRIFYFTIGEKRPGS